MVRRPDKCAFREDGLLGSSSRKQDYSVLCYAYYLYCIIQSFLATLRDLLKFKSISNMKNSFKGSICHVSMCINWFVLLKRDLPRLSQFPKTARELIFMYRTRFCDELRRIYSAKKVSARLFT